MLNSFPALNYTRTTTLDIYASILREAYEHALTESSDPNTKTSAFLVDDNGLILAKGANTFPDNIPILEERLKRPDKYDFIGCAERDVIYTAAKEGIKTLGLTMVVPWYACLECSKAIIKSGISRVVGHKTIMEQTPNRWKESIFKALRMMDEAGLELLLYDGQLNSRFLMDDKLYTC